MSYYKKHKDEPLTLGTFWGFTWRISIVSIFAAWPLTIGMIWIFGKINEIITSIEGYLAGRKARKTIHENEEDFED